ncbi:MAG TPA: phosphotransferase [Gammaproteobacteria bacterium]|nr:phosphotransferase [Gammaproteobacteria bacterium]
MGIGAASTAPADTRKTALADFCAAALGLAAVALEPASADASFRRYFRLRLAEGATLIAMDSPPAREALASFLAVARAFGGCGLHVPRVVAADETHGFALVEDLGSETYLARLRSGADPAPLYGAAIEALVRLQCLHDAGLPVYDGEQLTAETALFSDWLLERHLALKLGATERALVERSGERLSALALAQPRVAVHRDYHSRNLMIAAPLPGILDFQDAVLGPVSYDLVSLLKDCYIAWPRERILAWLRRYRELAEASDIPVGRDEAEFLRWFETMGMQRHLKAAGIFARLYHRDGKPDYLADIPRTLRYVVEAAEKLPEFADLGAFIAARVLPALTEAKRRCGR